MDILKKISRFYWKRIASPMKYAHHIGVKIGKGCFISTKEFPSEGYLIEIGDNVRIAPQTAFFTHGGVWSLRQLYNDPKLDHFGKIRVGNNSYIGERCMIMPGVTIGERCIVGGGSVVTKSVPDGCMVAGNPAKFIGHTEDFYHRLKDKHDIGTGTMGAEKKRQYLLSLNEALFESKPYIKVPE